MAKNPSHTNIPVVEGSSRIPQNNAIRTAKSSKIAKPSGIIGPKLSSLPKSLSNEKICQASSLVQKTTKSLFKSRFGKPPEPKPPAKMNAQQKPPGVQNSTFAVDTVNRPALTRSDTFVRGDDNQETSSKNKPNGSQSVDVANNLTQNVISKLQEQTFTTSNPSRMSISPVGPSYQFPAPRKMSDETMRPLPPQISSTPFRNIPIEKFSTQYLCEQKTLPPISFDITGTDLDSTTVLKGDPKNQLNSPNWVDNISPSLNCTQDIASTTKPEFLDMCTPIVPRVAPREKFNLLAEDMKGDALIFDTTLNLCASSAQNQDTFISKSSVIDDSKSTTMLLCLDDESRHENTLVPLVPVDAMEVDDRENLAPCAESNGPVSAPIDVQNKQRFSFGQDITEWTLDCSIELCDSSVGSSAANVGSPSHLKKQHSVDEKSLSILTPDQMKEFLDSNNTNLNLDLPLFPKMSMHQCRIDQTPSPEELPLDPVGVKTDISDLLTGNDNQMTSGQYVQEHQLSQTDSYSKTDQMTKSGASKVSNSFITSVTSITSLDTGYQGDGEMSRPASRGGDHSPSNMPRVHPMRPIVGREPSFMNNQNNIAIVRRQDPMTDSDFFTESDADDVINRGDRRAQVIDGQLYAPMVQGANVNHYVNQQPSTEDSCMESSGIFTDVENRADDELLHRHGHDSDMSPDGSTDTIKSSHTEYNNKKNSTVIQAHTDTFVNHQGHSMSDSTTSTINSSCEKGGDRQSVISEYSINSVHSIQSCDIKYGVHSCALTIRPHNFNRNNRINRIYINDNTLSLHFIEPKQNKNEANVALKKHEMSKSKRVVSGEKIRNGSSSGVVSSSADIENQENKRPTTGSSSRKVVPNKWDAVMNKIASNKTNVKSKNYNEVKSKVTCGLTKKDSPGLLKSPADDDLFVTTSKRNFQLSSKRGRTQSQQSSQSDISENVGSSKTNLRRANSSASPRAAKKRDVRAISNSPNDLVNAKSNGKCGNTKPVSLQKRLSNGSTPTVSSSPSEQKSSPPPKKFLSKRSSQPASKSPLKDHNRLVGSGTPTTTILQAAPRTIATNPRGIISPKTSKRVIPSHTSSHSNQNTTHHGNGIVQNDGIFNNKAHTSANQVDRIVNNGKVENRLNGIGSTRSVITATKATSTIDVVDANLIHANKGVAALGVLVKYLVEDLDAFNTPNLKKSNENVTKLLMETKLQLEHARLSCSQLEDQQALKEEQYTKREKEIQEHYKTEILKVENQLNELDQTSKLRVTSLEEKIISIEKEYEEKLQNVTNQFKATIAEKETELALAKNNEEEFSKRIRALSSTENELREKVLASETEFSERLQLAAVRERELNDKFNLLNKDLTDKERILTEKLNIAQNEILVLRNSRDSTPSKNVSTKVTKGQPMLLEDEIQSWRSVLEMKQKEISDLQKQNHELETAAATLPGALAKISGLESRLEDLEIQLKIKNDDEQELALKNKQLEQSFKQELKNRTLLALDNEQLKYRLKRNSEKFSSAIIELAKSQTDTSGLSDITLNGSDSYCTNTDSSPPTTPVIKGVVEKNASVSYVLEINDEESPEALASRIIRRAGSFRHNASDRNQSTPINRVIQHGNALAQSASATSILRNHSESIAHSLKNDSIRIRSKSVSTNSNDASDIIERKQSQSSQRDSLKPPNWNKPLCSSSPSKRSIKAANNSNDNDLLLSEESEAEGASVSRRPNADNGQYFRRSNSYKHTKRGLITCNTAALTSQRPDLCLSLPVHPTVKELKNCQRIKESAGEAMVSGTNSEDEEASTASSEGSLSSRSSSSGRRRSSIEDANIDKIVASLGVGGAGNSTPMELGGTPMEVSWSEDVDHFASDSAV